MEETSDQKRARIVAEVAKARLAQLESTEEEQNKVATNNKLTLNEALGLTNNRGKFNQSNVVINEISMHQKEFGARKFIKPWRTGVKSQQQIAPKGMKKGFRGK